MKRWPLYNANFWEAAPFFRILLPLAAGILCHSNGWLLFISGLGAVGIALLALLIHTATVYAGRAQEKLRFTGFVLLQLIMFTCGYSLAFFNDVRNDAGWYGRDSSATHTCLARIADVPVAREHAWKLRVDVISTVEDGGVTAAKGSAFLYLYKDVLPMLLQKGDSILLPDVWDSIRNAGNPFEFDYAAYCRRNNIYYRQSCSIKDIRLYAANDAEHAPFTERVHDWCMQQLALYISDRKASGLIQAMLLGDEVNLDEDLRQSYADTGIIHIIAISGGNVAIFFVVISFLLRWLKDKRHQWLKYAVALPLVWFYVLMAGAPPSAVRAAVMFSLLAFGIILQKNRSSLNLLFATAFVLLCANPSWLFSLGFQLSFVAVLSIILFYGPVYALAKPKRWLSRKLWATVAASIAAEVLVAPLVIYYFHMFPLLFVVANVAAFLFMELVLIASMALVLLAWLPVVANGLGIAISFVVTCFDRVVSYLQGFNPESFHCLMLTGTELCLSYAAIWGISLYVIRQRKRPLFAGLGACAVLLLLLCHDDYTSRQQQRLIVYNTAGTNYAELIQGKTYKPLQQDTVAAKAISYATKPAHTCWHAWRKSTQAPDSIYTIGGKTVLLLNADAEDRAGFAVDYLIINTPVIPQAEKLKRLYSPVLIVLGNRYTRQQRALFATDAASLGMAVHAVADKGAFIIETAQ